MDKHPSYRYALGVVKGEIKAPKYVILQCAEFVMICQDMSDRYVINRKRVGNIDKILKALAMPKGLKRGMSVYDALAGFQWFLIVASLCTVYRGDVKRRRYQTVILEIARKNGKTFVVALMFIILFYIEPEYSRFFSVAPDGSLAREIKEALEPLIRTNSGTFRKGEFKILRDYVLHTVKQTRYTPLNFSVNRMDGKEPNVFIADEVGALPTPYPVEAMRSGQLNVLNPLGFVISTKYPTVNNPFEDEVDNAKKVLDGIIEDETIFALLYEPDDTKNWQTNDDVLAHANPIALEIKKIWNDLIRKRRNAVNRESLRENFLTKHCNIIYQGAGTESFVSVTDVQACECEEDLDWQGRNVYLGVDLSMSNDNCGVAMAAVDEEDNIMAELMAFIPEGRIDEKSEYEHIDYRRFIAAAQCIACGDMTVDYGVIEDYVFGIEEKYGVTVVAIGYDRYNALSSAQKWDQVYKTVEIRQHSDTLHPPTKLLFEQVTNHRFRMKKNVLAEENFQNAKCTFDTNMNRYVNKKKSNGKVDLVVALINAVYLLQQDTIFDDGFVVQT